MEDHKTYAVLAVPDGDNLDFAAGRMWELWTERTRGTLPFAWSLNPILGDLASLVNDELPHSAWADAFRRGVTPTQTNG